MTDKIDNTAAAVPENLIQFMNHPNASSWVKIPGDKFQEVVRYDVFVALLFKQEATRQMLDHARAGICEEAGELSSVIKRNVVYGQALTDPMKEDGKPLLTHIIEELGDIRFFMQAVQNMYGIPEQAILQHNANKLAARYNQLMYSDVAAITRLDKDTGPVAAG